MYLDSSVTGGLQQPQFTPFFGRFGKITENHFDKTFVACFSPDSL
jgi:hypothetical protein